MCQKNGTVFRIASKSRSAFSHVPNSWRAFYYIIEILALFVVRTGILGRCLWGLRRPPLPSPPSPPHQPAWPGSVASATGPQSIIFTHRWSRKAPHNGTTFMQAPAPPTTSASLPSPPSIHLRHSNTRTPGYPPPPTTPAMHEMNTPLPLPRPSVRSCRLCPPYLPSSTRLARLLDTAASSRPLPSATKNGLRTTY